jgi:hypothetical protein
MSRCLSLRSALHLLFSLSSASFFLFSLLRTVHVSRRSSLGLSPRLSSPPLSLYRSSSSASRSSSSSSSSSTCTKHRSHLPRFASASLFDCSVNLRSHIPVSSLLVCALHVLQPLPPIDIDPRSSHRLPSSRFLSFYIFLVTLFLPFMRVRVALASLVLAAPSSLFFSCRCRSRARSRSFSSLVLISISPPLLLANDMGAVYNTPLGRVSPFWTTHCGEVLRMVRLNPFSLHSLCQ